MSKDEILVFHSRSKHEDGKYLSNFIPVNEGLTVECIKIEILKGKVFPSIEHAFQGVKFAMSGAHDGLLNELIQCTDAVQVQKMGQKKYFDKCGLKLDINKWSKCSVPLMRHLVRQRIIKDEKYRNIIEKYHNRLYHFSRAGKRSLWGGYFSKASGLWEGKNLLGKIMDEEYINTCTNA